jgi:hypothetical protein
VLVVCVFGWVVVFVLVVLLKWWFVVVCGVCVGCCGVWCFGLVVLVGLFGCFCFFWGV